MSKNPAKGTDLFSLCERIALFFWEQATLFRKNAYIWKLFILEAMIDQIIAGYMTHNHRLVVPGLGAFVKKDDNSRIVLVVFLKNDDGVLAGLLANERKSDQAKIADQITQYVKQLQDRIKIEGGYYIAGIGTLRTNERGVYYLDSEPSAASEVRKPDDIAFPGTVQPASPPVPAGPQHDRRATPDGGKMPETAHSGDAAPSIAPAPVGTPAGRGKKRDMFIVIAIIAAVLALFTIMYSLWVNQGLSKDQPEPEPVENVVQ